MNIFSRRDFLKASTGFLGYSLVHPSFKWKKHEPLLSFSTLGCPDWSFTTIVGFAAAHDYRGIELRGIKRELDLTKCPEFSNSENIKSSLKLASDKGIKFVDLGSSTALHLKDARERQENLDQAKRFIDLAQQLKCPYVRVFPNNLPKDRDKKETIDLIISGLDTLGNYSRQGNITVLMETHGDVVWSEDLQTIMKSVNHSHVGLVWDPINMWTVTREPPSLAHAKLKKWIHHAHIKDGMFVKNQFQYTLLGKGESPIFEAIDALAKDHYKGYYSFEWEKLWHPEIEQPETALAEYPQSMKDHFKKLK